MMIATKIAQFLKQTINDAAFTLLWGFNLSPLSEISLNIKVVNCNFHKSIYNPSKLRLFSKNRRTFPLPKISNLCYFAYFSWRRIVFAI